MRKLAFAVALACCLPGWSFEPGKLTPEFSFSAPGGANVSLSQYRGKVIALAFISTTCPHCQALTRELIPLQKEYAAQGVQFLECAINPGGEMNVPEFIKQFQTTFPVGWTTEPAAKAYLGISVMDQRIFYVPHLVFIDRGGIVRGDFPGE